MSNKYITTADYAKKASMSRMHVVRLIKMGKLPAVRIGKQWLIESFSGEQSGLEKTTSLQKWDKIIQQNLNKKLHIEKSKDREIIYSRMGGLGLPHERCLAYDVGHTIKKSDLKFAISKLGLPFWISAVPSATNPTLNRLSKLGVDSVEDGWNFINKLPSKNEFKIILAQYPSKTTFKGTALVSKKGFGVAEFVTGDRHYIMTRGFTLTDPMLFNTKKIVRYSMAVEKDKQDELFNLLYKTPGHFEFQYAILGGKLGYTFFDYNTETAYLKIETIWKGLFNHYKNGDVKNSKLQINGLPASLGKARGRAVIVHHESFSMSNDIDAGDILVSDTTTPDMTTVMGKVAAIVTDLGGVTSHAAIVCRELGIPAIVGTTNATEILRNGDLIEVDANNGIVKILERS